MVLREREGGCRWGVAQSPFSAAIGVATVVDVEHVDGPGLVFDSVAYPVLAAPSPPLPFEGFSQRCSYSAGVLREEAEDELDARRSDRFGQVLGQASRRATGHDDPVAHRDECW